MPRFTGVSIEKMDLLMIPTMLVIDNIMENYRMDFQGDLQKSSYNRLLSCYNTNIKTPNSF